MKKETKWKRSNILNIVFSGILIFTGYFGLTKSSDLEVQTFASLVGLIGLYYYWIIVYSQGDLY